MYVVQSLLAFLVLLLRIDCRSVVCVLQIVGAWFIEGETMSSSRCIVLKRRLAHGMS